MFYICISLSFFVWGVGDFVYFVLFINKVLINIYLVFFILFENKRHFFQM